MNTYLPVQHDDSRLPGALASAGAPSPGAADPQRNAFDVMFLAAILRRRWLLIAAVVVGITGAAAAYAWTREAVYEARAQIMIGMPHGTQIDLGGLVTGVPVNQERIENEMQILQSRSLARQVIETAALDRQPEINPAIGETAAAQPLLAWAQPWLERLPSRDQLVQMVGLGELLAGEPSQGDDTATAGREPIDDMVDRFLDSLEVEPAGRSHVINLTYRAEDPQLAAKAANALAHAYLEDRLQAKLTTARRASDWLDQRIEALRRDAEQKEAAVEAYRSKAGLVATEGASLAAVRIAELNRELAAAQGAEAQAAARYGKVREALASSDGAAVPEVLNSRTIQELRAEEAVAAAQYEELAREYGPRHPKMIDIRAQLKGIRSQIRAETRRILDSIRNESDVARARSARLQQEISRLEEQIRDRNDAEGQLRVLEREAEAAQEAYRTFLMRANTGGQQEALETPDGRLISAAEVPAGPAGPNRRLLVALGFVGACLTGVGLSLGLEMLDRRFRTPDQIRARLRLPVLGVIPMLSSLTRTRRAPQDHVVDGPDSAFGEAIRALRNTIAVQGGRPSPRVVLMTSSVQGEGKTTLCLAVGRHAAMSGRRAVVVDCDLRLPRIHDGLGVQNGPGVIEYINGSTLSEVLRVDRHTGLHFVSAGTWQRNAPELLAHARMRELISLLRGRYDLVLIDTPPLLPVSDSSVIAGLADMAMLVIGWPDARPDTVEVALNRLRAAAGRAQVGAVFNNVDVHKVTGYGFAEIDAYRGGYSNYYVAA